MKLGWFLATAVLLGILSTGAVAQADQQFVDPEGKFKVSLAGDWRAVSYSDAVGRKKTEFVYRDRSEGLLKISKENLAGRPLAQMVRDEEENLRTYRAGFERAASEAFGGGVLRGVRLSFYSTQGGRQVASTFYYLEDGSGVWVLRFSGRRGSLDTIRNLTDQIARSFEPTS